MQNLVEQLARIMHRARQGDELEDQVLSHVGVGKRDAVPDGEGVELPEFGEGGGAGVQQRDAFLENIGFSEIGVVELEEGV